MTGWCESCGKPCDEATCCKGAITMNFIDESWTVPMRFCNDICLWVWAGTSLDEATRDKLRACIDGERKVGA